MREHLVDAGIVLGDVGHVGDRRAGPSPSLIALSMPSASTSTFIRPRASMSSLSHSMKVRSFIAALPIGTGLVQPPLGQDEAAHVLRQMAGKAHQLAPPGPTARRISGLFGIEAGLADVVLRQALAPAGPDGVGQGRGDVLGKPQRLAHVTDGAARAVMDHRGADRRPVPAVATVDVLHHLLAPLVLEVDVDVRRLVSFPRHEPGEEQIVIGLHRIDRGDAQAEADHRIGRRPAPLAKDALIPRPVDDVVHGEEVVGVIRAPRSGPAPRGGAFWTLSGIASPKRHVAPAQARSVR